MIWGKIKVFNPENKECLETFIPIKTKRKTVPKSKCAVCGHYRTVEYSVAKHFKVYSWYFCQTHGGDHELTKKVLRK